MKNKKVVYTAIFGGKDILHDPKIIPEGFDFICFTDDRSIRSRVWQVRYVDKPFQDPVRCARYYKILAHHFLPSYEISVWIDGNMIVIGDLNKLLYRYIPEFLLITYNHFNLKRRFMRFFWKRDTAFARNCIYKEAEALLIRTENGFYMDNPDLIKSQIKKYKAEGYPENNGLAVTMVMIRQHNQHKVIKLMNDWWEEISKYSRRDQLSFNYVAWKNSFPVNYIDGDPRYNSFFAKVKHLKKENPR